MGHSVRGNRNRALFAKYKNGRLTFKKINFVRLDITDVINQKLHLRSCKIMKKILILTLGVGSVLGKKKEDNSGTEAEKRDRLREMIDNDIYPYDKTDYVVEIPGSKNGKIVQTEYVAEIQIQEYQPDMVIIIGTVKSCWSMFYRKFTQNSEIDRKVLKDDIEQLYQIEQSYGKDTANNTLKELERIIQNIYNGKLVFSESKKIDIKVCLIRYGVNNDQLLENYKNISNIENYLDKNEEYDVAFDITHSFRSLPIYNLIILNYLQQVSSYRMKISHIYYGNYDVKRENNNLAPVVDLADMVEVLNLTNAISEFKNTGNAATLYKMLPEEEKNLRKALEKFDWATQINGRDEVINAVKELSEILSKKQEERNRYFDIKNMLKTVLGEGTNNLLQITDCDNKGKAQLLLAQWYQKQNRYGLAVATAMEALRSLLVPYYLKNFHPEETDLEKESRRKEAVQRLDIVSRNREIWIESDITDFLVNLENLRKNDVAPIRNIFAHNLKENEYDDLQKAKDIIDRFIGSLEKLYKLTCERETEFKEVYCYEPNWELIRHTNRHRGENIRVFISEEDNVCRNQCEKMKRSSNGKRRYHVWKLPVEVVGKATNKIEPSKFVEKGCTIGEYIKRHFETENIQIILDGRMQLKKWMYYSILLYDYSFSDVSYIKDGLITKIPKPVFKLSYQIPEHFNEEIMHLEPKEI